MFSVVRLQWVRAVAARDRWREEKLLLIEEGHRILASFEAEQVRWARLGESVADGNPPPSTDDRLERGLACHLFSQASVYGRLAMEAKLFADSLPSRDSLRHIEEDDMDIEEAEGGGP